MTQTRDDGLNQRVRDNLRADRERVARNIARALLLIAFVLAMAATN